jgi:hypothetical protein
MFRPVRIDGRLLIDGGYSDRAGFAALARGERTFYHHLPHGSPWSGFAGPEARELEPRPGRLTLVVPGLPRLGPFRLQAGPRVLSAAREHALRWLEGECGPEGPS